MTRKLLAALFFVPAVAFLMTVRADDPAAKSPEPKKADAPAAAPLPSQGDVTAKEKLLREEFENFKNEVLKLKQRLETSDKEEDKATVKTLDKVLKEINDLALDGKFEKVIETLQKPNTLEKIPDVTQVAAGNKELQDAMQRLIDLLQNGDDLAIKHKEILENEKLLEKLKDMLGQQERLIARGERGASGKDLSKPEGRIRDDLKGILDPNKEAKPDFKKSEAKYDNKPGSDARGEAKNDTQAPKGAAKDEKAGENKDGMKPGEDKAGDNKDGMKPGAGKEGDNKDGMKPSDGKGGENKDGMKPGEGKEGDKGGEAKEGDKPSEAKDGKAGDKDAKPGEGKEAGNMGGDNKESKPGENKDGKGGDSKDGKAGEGKQGDKAGEGKLSEGKDGKGGESKDGKPGEGKQGAQSDPNGKPGEGKQGAKPGDNPMTGQPGQPGQGKEAGKPGEGKPGEPKPGDGQANSKPGEGKGNEAKPGTTGQPGQPGEGKPNGKPGDGKAGDAKQGKPSDGKAGDGKAGDPKSGKPGDGKAGDGKPSEAKSGSDQKGQADGKGESKPGDPKAGMNPSDGGKPSESKGNPSAGQPSQGQPSQGKGDGSPSDGGASPPPPKGPQPHLPVRKQIEDGEKDTSEAHEKFNQDDAKNGLPPANKGAEDIQKAIKKLEEIINADRQEEIDRILERLQARCARMLAMQIAVRDGTVKLDEKIQDIRKQKGDERSAAQDSNVLSDREYEIVKEADRALALLENDGTAIAFAEMFQMVRKDMLVVKDRLAQTDTGTVTVAVEDQVIKNLSDMVEALKKQREINKNKGPNQPKPPGPPKPPGEDPLVDIIAQLRLLRSMQKGLNDRTELYHKEYESNGEQAPAPAEAKDSKERQHYEMIQKEMKDLADTEAKISKVLKDMLTGKNRVD